MSNQITINLKILAGRILIFILAIFFSTQSAAFEIEETLIQIKSWQSKIAVDDISNSEAQTANRRLNDQIISAESCVALEASKLGEIESVIKSFVQMLPNSIEDKESKIKSQKSPSEAAQTYIDQYTAEKQLIQKRLADCKYLEIEGGRTLKSLARLKKTEITGFLGARDEPPAMDVWRLLSGGSIVYAQHGHKLMR